MDFNFELLVLRRRTYFPMSLTSHSKFSTGHYELKHHTVYVRGQFNFNLGISLEMKNFNPIRMIKSQLHVDSLESFTDCFHKVRFERVSNFHPIDNLADVMITFLLKGVSHKISKILTKERNTLFVL
jgi:hypothetical protein